MDSSSLLWLLLAPSLVVVVDAGRECNTGSDSATGDVWGYFGWIAAMRRCKLAALPGVVPGEAVPADVVSRDMTLPRASGRCTTERDELLRSELDVKKWRPSSLGVSRLTPSPDTVVLVVAVLTEMAPLGWECVEPGWRLEDPAAPQEAAGGRARTAAAPLTGEMAGCAGEVRERVDAADCSALEFRDDDVWCVSAQPHSIMQLV